MTAEQRLAAAIDAFNKAALEGLQVEHGLRYRRTPAVYQAGRIRIGCMFTGPDGRHWADGALVAESVNSLPDVSRDMAEYWSDQPSQVREADDLWVFTETRGRWNAIVAPVTEIARIFELDEPVRMPAGNWARTWWDLPQRTDGQELAWVAAGGVPFAEHRTGGRW